MENKEGIAKAMMAFIEESIKKGLKFKITGFEQRCKTHDSCSNKRATNGESWRC